MNSWVKRELLRFLEPLHPYFDPILKDLMGMSEDVLLFGGLLRRLALGTFPGYGECDLDLVLVGAQEEDFVRWGDLMGVQATKYGGYRVSSHSEVSDQAFPLEVPLDVWRIEDTWAFKVGLVKFVDKLSLLDSTFFNCDSIIYSFRDQEVSCSEAFLSFLQTREIAINLNECAYPANQARKAGELSGLNLTLSEELKQFVKKYRD